MNNLDFKMKSIYHRNPETTLMLNGIQYTLYWTPHARERIISRLKSSLMLQNTYILVFIYGTYLNLFRLFFEFFKTGLFAVINVYKNKIRIITCGDVNHLYPYANNLTIQRNIDNTFRIFNWAVS